ncbi:neuronal pentraxin receptor-like protein [Lates japonicus]|nr:neuronal pentraxin receptor-like protein [Lates japonicus]
MDTQRAERGKQQRLWKTSSQVIMKFVVVLVGAGSLAFLGAVICIIASVYPRKRAAPLSDNGTLTSETLLQTLEPGSVAHAGPLGALHGAESYDGGNGLGGIGLEVPTLNELNLGEETGGGGSAKQFSFSRLICTPVPVEDCKTKDLRQRREQQQQQQQADEPLYGTGDEDWAYLRTTAEELRQTVLQQNDQILMDQRTIRELTGKLSECESGLEDERSVPERSIGVWSGNRRVMAGDDVSSSAAAQLQTARAVEELARAIMDLKDRIEKLEAEIGPAALNLTDTSLGASSPPAAAAPGARRPASHAPKPPSKGSPGRGKGTWRVEDLEGELERKIKMLEKERQAVRKETQGQHEKINQGIDTVNHRVTELEHRLGMAGTGEGKKEEADYKRLHSFPLIRHTDMPEEMRVETMELCVTACEKFATNNESAAKMIKESMDKKFGSSWHVVIGEGFGFEVTHEVKNLLYMFFGGSLAVCVWKCS